MGVDIWSVNQPIDVVEIFGSPSISKIDILGDLHAKFQDLCQKCTIFSRYHYTISHIQHCCSQSLIESKLFILLVLSGRSSGNVTVSSSRRRLSTDPRSCEQCGRTFKYPSDLKKHLQIHTGKKVCKYDISNVDKILKFIKNLIKN